MKKIMKVVAIMQIAFFAACCVVIAILFFYGKIDVSPLIGTTDYPPFVDLLIIEIMLLLGVQVGLHTLKNSL